MCHIASFSSIISYFISSAKSLVPWKLGFRNPLTKALSNLNDVCLILDQQKYGEKEWCKLGGREEGVVQPNHHKPELITKYSSHLKNFLPLNLCATFIISSLFKQ